MTKVTQRRLSACIRRALKPIIISSLSTSVGLTALPAMAQEEGADEFEEVVVTGSRIRTRTDGFESPQPVTVVTLEEINLINPASVIDGLADLPQFNGSFTTENFGGFSFVTSPGSGTLSLRGLQGKRTLTLLDGKRVVGASLFGGPDANLFPTQLLRTVESVTGGASAAYGTDAVAGAVNFILDKQYTGVKARVSGGANENGEFANYGYSIAGGFSPHQRINLLFSAERQVQEETIGLDKVDWYTGTRYIDNPDPNAGESPANPLLIPAPQIVSNQTSFDGIAFFPQLIGNANTARREDFIARYGHDRFAVNPDGSAGIFKNGAYFDTDANSLVGGGSGTINNYYTWVGMPQAERESYFGRIGYDVTDQLTLYAEGMTSSIDNRRPTPPTDLGGAQSVSVSLGGIQQNQYAPLIFSGNPFIPAEVQQVMDDEGFNYLSLGRMAHPSDLGIGFQQQDSETRSLNVGFDYRLTTDGLFNDWMISGYYQSGRTDTAFVQGGLLRQDRAYLALDAVRDPATGEIICNVTQYLDHPMNVGQNLEGCVPWNPFGRGQASQAALDWITDYNDASGHWVANGHFVNEFGEYDPIPHEYTATRYKRRVIDLYLDNWEISADGNILPNGLGLGAGPVAMAIGFASRKESFRQVVEIPGLNPDNHPDLRPSGFNNAAAGRRGISTQIMTSYNDTFRSNVPFAKGAYEVDEAFIEFLVPVVNSLDIGLAYRYADYVTIDEQVDSWKLSYTWRATQQLRFRGTVSGDVRAPTMAERYDRTGGGVFFVRDYVIKDDCAFFEAGCYQSQVLSASFGSKDLKPEDARTVTMGLIYQPNWAEGLSFSMDWYRIRIEDNINQLGGQAVIEGCAWENIQALCDLIVRDGPPSDLNPDINMISYIYNPYMNQDYTLAKGTDFEIAYRRSVNWFGGSNVNVRFLGSHLDTQVLTTNGIPSERVGIFWAPWTWNLSGGITRGPLSITLRTNYAGKLPVQNGRNSFDETEQRIIWDVANNVNERPFYLDGNVSYRFNMQGNSRLSLGLNFQNLFDKAPEANPNSDVSVFTQHDLRGRRYTMSVNFEY